MPTRAFPSAQADRLRKLNYTGTFEAHLTVQADNDMQRRAFETLCGALHLKCVLIELAKGQTPSQPMTASYHRGDMDTVLEEVERLHQKLYEGGFEVVRVKLEAIASNPGVPSTDADAAKMPHSYFEFHIKLSLPEDFDERLHGPLLNVCERHSAHLSRNKRKTSPGRHERFVTLRVYGAGRPRAESDYEALRKDLLSAGYEVCGQIREFTIYDSRATLDAGWLDAPKEDR